MGKGRINSNIIVCSFFAVSVLAVVVPISAGEEKVGFSVHLKVIDSDGKPIPGFDVRVYSSEEGFAPWRQGKEGEILLQSKDGDFPFFGRAMRYQIIIRAPGFAPKIFEMDRSRGDIERTVTLNKGRPVELQLTTSDKRVIPQTLVPIIAFPDFQEIVWSKFHLRDMQKHDLDINFTSLIQRKPGHYVFYVAEDLPEIYVFVDHPGFIRAFRAGLFSWKDLADGRLDIELPEPARIEVVFAPPKDWTGNLPYTKCRMMVMRKDPEGGNRLFPLVSIKSESPSLYMNPEFFAPGDYWIQLNTMPSNGTEEFVEGKANPAFYRDMKQFSLTAGQAEKVMFQYTPYDENDWKGDYSTNVSIRLHNGKAAAAVPYALYYWDIHFGLVSIKDGVVPDNGQIEFTGLAGGDNAPYFTLVFEKGRIGRYTFQLLGKEKSRELEYKIAPQENDTAPDITVIDIFTGEKVKISDYKGKVLFVEFWATWCGPCQSPTAKLCEVASKRKNDWADKAAILCVSIDDKKEDVISYVNGRGWLGVRHLWCEEGEPGFKSVGAKTYGIDGVPTAVLIDKSGAIIWRGHPGTIDIEAKLDELIKNGD
jgi:thiol-disulfide isomerase/thioredoxin